MSVNVLTMDAEDRAKRRKKEGSGTQDSDALRLENSSDERKTLLSVYYVLYIL